MICVIFTSLLFLHGAAETCTERKDSGCTACPGYWYQTCPDGFKEDGWNGCGFLGAGCKVWCKRTYYWPCKCGLKVCPTPNPSPRPSPYPTPKPSPYPTPYPTPLPTEYPTPEPTLFPTHDPSIHPTPSPTQEPSPAPTTMCPTVSPSESPTKKPSRYPSTVPTAWPSVRPTHSPSYKPTRHPLAIGTSLVIETFYSDSECTEEIMDIGGESALYTNDCLKKNDNMYVMNTCVSDGKIEVKMYSAAGCNWYDVIYSLYLVHDECTQVDTVDNTYKKHTIKGHCPGAAYCPEGTDWKCPNAWHLSSFVEGEQPVCNPGSDAEAEIGEEQCGEEYHGKYVVGGHGGSCVPPELVNERCAGYWKMEHEVFGADVCLHPNALCEDVTPAPTVAPSSESPTSAPIEASVTESPTKGKNKTKKPTDASDEECGFPAKKVTVTSTHSVKKTSMKGLITDPNVAACTCQTICEFDSIVWSYNVHNQKCTCYVRKEGTVVTVETFKKAKTKKGEKASVFISVNKKGKYES